MPSDWFYLVFKVRMQEGYESPPGASSRSGEGGATAHRAADPGSGLPVRGWPSPLRAAPEPEAGACGVVGPASQQTERPRAVLADQGAPYNRIQPVGTELTPRG